MATILPFPVVPSTQPLALFVRVGTAHKKLADLYAAGRLAARRVVVDASSVKFQGEFLRTLRDDGVEIVLDTEIAELSSARKFPGHGRFSPWIRAEVEVRRPFTPANFSKESIHRLTTKIAEFAVEHHFTTVLSPSHFLGDRNFDGWLAIDIALCDALRKALDRAGGHEIAIDYPVILVNADLKDVAVRGDISAALSVLPINNVWIRASGMDGIGGSLKTIRYLNALAQFHNVGRPIIADYLGGLTSLAAMAFGSVSGVAHGIADRERFDARDWHLPPVVREDDEEGFGKSVRIEIPNFGKAPTRRELELIASAPGGRRLCSCADRHCCPHGLDDMMRDPRSHAAYRAISTVRTLEEIPPANRESFFLKGTIAATVRTARDIAKLRPTAEAAKRLELDGDGLMQRYATHSRHVDGLAIALEALHERHTADMPRAKPVTNRGPKPSEPKEARP